MHPTPSRSKPGELADRAHWDQVYFSVDETHGRLGSLLLKLFGPGFFERYSQKSFWDTVFPQVVSTAQAARMIEIGVAPGGTLIRQCKRRGFDPWGLDYSLPGVEHARQVFAKAGYEPDHVIFGDILDESLASRLANRFDIVYSAGLIEHFEDPSELIAQHIRLASEGGFIVISIPNFQGINGKILRLVDPELLDKHNLGLMKLSNFREAFSNCGATLIYCRYIGFWDTDGADVEPKTWIGRAIQRPLRHLNLLVNAAARWLVPLGRCETPMTSPTLVAILRKDTKRARPVVS